MATHSLYTLSFDSPDGAIVFYVGCTNNPGRRLREHKTNSINKNHSEYMTFKYQFCRMLNESEAAYKLDVIIDDIVADEDSEYEWILKFARHNTANGFKFIDGYPLTNMKAGDFLSEIISRPEIRTARDIKKYKSDKIESEKQAREIRYNRAMSEPKSEILRMQYAKRYAIMEGIKKDAALAMRRAQYKEQQDVIRREKAEERVSDIFYINDRIARLKAETERLENRL